MHEVEETAGEVLQIAIHSGPLLHEPCAGPLAARSHGPLPGVRMTRAVPPDPGVAR